VEGSIAEKWKDRLGKKVKVSLYSMFKVISSTENMSKNQPSVK
jgi:hypothetical protein